MPNFNAAVTEPSDNGKPALPPAAVGTAVADRVQDAVAAVLEAGDPRQWAKLPKAQKVLIVRNAIANYLRQMGHVPEQQLIDYATATAQGDMTLAYGQIQQLHRSDIITRRIGPDGRTAGYELRVQQGASRKKYGGFSSWRFVTMGIRTPVYGQVSNDDQNFRLERDAEGNVVLGLATFHTMLTKAWYQAELRADPESGEMPPQASVRRWRARFLGIRYPKTCRDADGKIVECDPLKLPRRQRRPINEQGKAVGVLYHEVVPEGAQIDWAISWPTSHWNAVNAAALLEAAQDVGFTPSGGGKYGGNRGLFYLTVNPNPRLIHEVKFEEDPQDGLLGPGAGGEEEAAGEGGDGGGDGDE